MLRLVFTPAAQSDLIDIADYIEHTSASLETAARFCEGLVAKCERLAELPGVLGRARPELLPHLRSTPHDNYVIFFQYLDDTLEVVNILHAHRDIAALFRTNE